MNAERTSSAAPTRAAPAARPPGARKAELHLWYATLTVTLASGVMSTIGVYEVLAANRAYGFSLSLLVGVVITAMLSGAWRYLFHALPRARGAALVNLCLLLVPFLALVFLVSTWTNATAVVGGPALNMHNRQFLNQYEQALEAANRQVEASARTLAAMRAEAGAFRADVEGEIAEGRLTGYAGHGVVSATLEQIADKLDAMVAEAEAASESAARTSAEASAAFAEVQSHLEQGMNDPAFVKERLERIRHAVIQLDEQSPAAVIASVLPAIGEGIAFRAADGRSIALRERQAEALEGAVRPRVEQTFAALEDLARRTAAGTVELPRFEHLSAPEAAMRYLEQFPIYWGMAIAIDAMPLLFLILLVVSAPRGAPGFELTANELHLALAVYADLRHLVEGSGQVTLLPRGRQARQ
jgi:hypothetical protein